MHIVRIIVKVMRGSYPLRKTLTNKGRNSLPLKITIVESDLIWLGLEERQSVT